MECFESYHSHFDELGPQNRSSRTVCVRVSLRSDMLNARLINNQPCMLDEHRITDNKTRNLFASVLNRALFFFFLFFFVRSSVFSHDHRKDGRGRGGGRRWRARWRTRAQRDPIVKLVVACCFSRFHITAIFDDLDRRFLQRIRVSSVSMETPIDPIRPFRYWDIAEIPIVFLRGNLCSKNGKIVARVHRSQSGCDMLIRAFISQPALMSVASRRTNDYHRFSSSSIFHRH